MSISFDFIVIGGGIAGASAAYFLSQHGRVVVLERESQPGYHSTGRSAALYTEAYGNETVRALTSGGRRFFLEPPAGFTDSPILSQRGAMFIGRADQMEALAATVADASALVPSVRQIGAADAREIIPALREDYVAGAVMEPEAMDIDVHALHQGFLRGARAEGGELVVNAEVEGLSRTGDGWRVATKAGEFTGAVVLNAAGAWCDEVGALAGAAPIGLVPKRRTAIHFRASGDYDPDAWPLCVDVDEEFYFKPDAGKLIGSPADETPMPPQDIQPDEMDIAIAADRIMQATHLNVERIEHRWAGLRSFVEDKTLVAGFDDKLPGFFWVAGQGGYGIQTSPSMGRVVAALATGNEIPGDLQDFGVGKAALSVERLRT